MSGALRPNRFAHVTIRHLAGEPVELRVWSVTRSRGAKTLNLSKGMRSDFDQLCKIAASAHSSDCTASARSIDDYVVLAALGLWAPENELVDPILLEAPIRSVPAAPAELWPAGGFALRGAVWRQDGPQPCEFVRDVPLGCLSACRPILWHKGHDLAPTLPWWPDASCLAAIEAVQQGAPLHPDMLPSLRALADQGILVRRPPKAAVPIGLGIDWNNERVFFSRKGFVNL